MCFMCCCWVTEVKKTEQIQKCCYSYLLSINVVRRYVLMLLSVVSFFIVVYGQTVLQLPTLWSLQESLSVCHRRSLNNQSHWKKTFISQYLNVNKVKPECTPRLSHIFIQTHLWDSSAFYCQQRLSVNWATDSFEHLMFFSVVYIHLENDKNWW